MTTNSISDPPTEFKPLFDWKKFIIKVQGQQDYLPVAGRLVWFRQAHPDWGITTEIVTYDIERKYAVVRAAIIDASGTIISQATKQENAQGFGDYLEKAETGAVGRALAYAGFGTQFAKELGIDNTGKIDDVVDSPMAATTPNMTTAEKREHTEIATRIVNFLEATQPDFKYHIIGYMDHRQWVGKVQDQSLANLREYDEWITAQVAEREAINESAAPAPVASRPIAAEVVTEAEELDVEEARRAGVKELNAILNNLIATDKSAFKRFAVAAFGGVFRPIDMSLPQVNKSLKALAMLAEDPFWNIEKYATEGDDQKGHGAS